MSKDEIIELRLDSMSCDLCEVKNNLKTLNQLMGKIVLFEERQTKALEHLKDIDNNIEHVTDRVSTLEKHDAKHLLATRVVFTMIGSLASALVVFWFNKIL